LTCLDSICHNICSLIEWYSLWSTIIIRGIIYSYRPTNKGWNQNAKLKPKE
jgi:hypothetical protein